MLLAHPIEDAQAAEQTAQFAWAFSLPAMSCSFVIYRKPESRNHQLIFMIFTAVFLFWKESKHLPQRFHLRRTSHNNNLIKDLSYDFPSFSWSMPNVFRGTRLSFVSADFHGDEDQGRVFTHKHGPRCDNVSVSVCWDCQNSAANRVASGQKCVLGH